MIRIFPDYTYGPGPRGTCWWDETVPAPDWPLLDRDLRVDVAIIGGGFTGASAALRLAEAGTSVALIEAGAPGWGASGRNGGFCCLGGGVATNAMLTKRFGDDGRRQYRQAEKAAIAHADTLMIRHGIDADRHSMGETLLAHRSRSRRRLDDIARRGAEDYGVEVEVLGADALPGRGLGSGFFGAATMPLGFAVNPRKLLFGVAGAAAQAGAQTFANSPVTAIRQTRVDLELDTPGGQIRAERVIVATNAYASEDIPPWIAARFLPVQSTILVSRPLTREERERQGWTSRQMCYDTRNLLHYFRLLPDNRMLFGTRGGILSSPRAEVRALARARRDFEAYFPAWTHIDTPFGWSGMVCLTGNGTPYVGPIPDLPGAFAAFGYHGNGVAMGLYAGDLVASQVLGADPAEIPVALRRPAGRFPFGRYRRVLVPPVYLAMNLGDI
ncbi:MAG: NAD(P)/FAD-dependent oxidoreductase [Marinibacterium sp.]